MILKLRCCNFAHSHNSIKLDEWEVRDKRSQCDKVSFFFSPLQKMNCISLPFGLANDGQWRSELQAKVIIFCWPPKCSTQNQICVRAALNTSKHPNVNAIEVEVEVACVENVKNGNRMELINCGGCACLTLGTFNLNICYFWTVGLHQRAFDVC